MSELIAKAQRDADHQYYLREFVKWVRGQGIEMSLESEALFSQRNGYFISLEKLGLLQKEGGENENPS